MHTIDVQTYPDLEPAAELALGSLGFGRSRLQSLLKTVTPEELYAKPANFKNSVATLVNHLAATEINMSHLILGRPVPADLAAEFFLDRPPSPLPEPQGATVAGLQEKLATSWDYVTEAFSTLKPEDYGRIVQLGPELKCSVRWMVGLLPVHQFLHLGQMQMLLNQLRG